MAKKSKVLKFKEAHYEETLEQSQELQGAMGALAFVVLEMFRRGGMPNAKLNALMKQMNTYFTKPTDEDCNVLLKTLETRLESDRSPGGYWY